MLVELAEFLVFLLLDAGGEVLDVADLATLMAERHRAFLERVFVGFLH